jgi:hypothetical protein
MIGPRDISASLRRHLFPALKAAGFDPVGPRGAFRRIDGITCQLSYRCVGARFSASTGFPSLSLDAQAGVHFDCVPNPFSDEVPRDKSGMPLAMEVHRSLGGDRKAQPRRGMHAAEMEREDIWWIEPDGSNLEAAVTDLARTMLTEALPWFNRWDSAKSALASSLEEPRDYPGRTWRIYALAKALGRDDVMASHREALRKQWPNHCHRLL